MNPILVERYRNHPGRGGCGVGAIADLGGRFSRDLVELGLAGLRCLEHRGGAIDDTADGAGLLLTIDREFFGRFIAKDRHLPDGHALAIGVCFFPRGEAANLPHWQREIDQLLRRQGLAPLGWRHVPIDEGALGRTARESRRDVWQVLVGEGMVPEEDLPLVLWRTKALLEQRIHDLYLASFSHRTVVYKALATGEGLGQVFPDLLDPSLRARAVVFHRRYSTNTFSNWTLAQAFRLLGHNGEINTIKANRNATENLQAELGMGPVLMPQGSDSADLDRVVELFVSHGVSLPEAIVRVMPMAWKDLSRLTPEIVRYHQGVQRALGSLGAWEGPAAIVATDGKHLVGSLDRMGLRPLRWLRTHSGRVIIASEVGAVPVDPADVAEAGQLDPGEVISVDLETGTLYRPDEVIARVVAQTSINFAELAETRLTTLPRREQAPRTPPKPDNAILNLFGWTSERVRNVKHMAQNGKEAITSMGYDRPLPPLSGMRPALTKFFKQIVAVVTNPPIDPIREGGAFDLTVHLGASPGVHENRPVYTPRPQVRLPSPILTDDQAQRIASGTGDHLPAAVTLDVTFEDPANGVGTGAKAVSRRIAELVRDAVGQVRRDEASVLILSDRAAAEPPADGAPPRLPLPMVLVNAALHNGLTEAGVRRRASIVVETGEIQEGHDAAVFLATGADAVHPWLFYQVGAPHGPASNLAAALDETLKRAMSKMGICSVDGYRGSRLFEAVGLAPAVVDHYLPGITTRLGGLGLEELYDDLRARRALGGAPQHEPDLAVYRKAVWEELQVTARGHDPASFGRFLGLIADTPPVYLRDLMVLKQSPTPISEDEVAPLEEIIRAVFRGAAMSHGALHRVAHRAIAAAFNKFDAASNCGEGGEDERRDRGREWEESRSRIRQVASGRFGVDARYLAHADELSIKIGQGAKPGEGGMLPGAKVTAEVAAIRKTQVGITLISPPPHHDIYSIEDLAQLVYDLKQANPRAKVSVKIPAVTDIGTIAVGIAKAGADVIDVSGFEGGTGAATSSSIEHAGLPLERGLSETHQALVLSGVRDRVRLRADGGIKTGFDVAAVLALGADEVSLGTALMIAEQCIFCHGCAAGMCPAGITTQSDLVARRLMTIKKGRGKDDALPDLEEERYQDAKQGVERYLYALAGDLRRHLASLGLRHPDQLTGRVDLLERRVMAVDPTGARRYGLVDLSELLLDPWDDGSGAAAATQRPRRPRTALPVDPTSTMNRALVTRAAAGELTIASPIVNTDRAVGATLAGALALGELTPAGPLTIALTGVAGQALGFACVEGLRIELDGFANDKVGAAMSGGAIVVRVPAAISADVVAGGLSVIGNAAAYGATGGALFVEGRAGQRVGVRNSGATIVVEGAGKYAFEYMTGGVGVVLGPIGPVVGSGMTGGVLYLEGDLDGLAASLHVDVVATTPGPDDVAQLRGLLEAHRDATGSARATAALGALAADPARPGFVRVSPKPA